MAVVVNVRYKLPDAREWVRMTTGPEIAAAVTTVALKGKVYAEEISVEFRDTGNYMSSFKVRTGTAKLYGRRRFYADLINDARPIKKKGRGKGKPNMSAESYAAQVEVRHQVLTRTRDYLNSVVSPSTTRINLDDD